MKSMKVSNLLRRGGKDDKKGLLKKNSTADDDDEENAPTELSESPASSAGEILREDRSNTNSKDANSFAADFSSMESLPTTKSVDSSEREDDELQKHIGELPSRSSPPGKSTRWIRNSSNNNDPGKKRGGNRSSKKMSSSLRSNDGSSQGNIGELAFKPKGLENNPSTDNSQQQQDGSVSTMVDPKKALLKQKKRQLVRSVSSSNVPDLGAANAGFRRFSPQRRNSTMGMSSLGHIHMQKDAPEPDEKDIDLKVNEENAQSEAYVQMSFTPEAMARSASFRNLIDTSDLHSQGGGSEDVTKNDEIPPPPPPAESETPSESKRKSPRRSKSGRKDLGKGDDKKRGDLKSSRRESFRVSRSRSNREVSSEEDRPGLSSKRESFRRRGSARNLAEGSGSDRPGMSRRESFRSRRASGSARNLVADVSDVLTETLNGKPKVSRKKSGRGLSGSGKSRSSRELTADGESTEKEESSKHGRRSSRRSRSSRAAIADMADEVEEKPKSSKSTKSKSKSMKNSSSHTDDTDDMDSGSEHNNKKSSKSSKKKSSKKSDDEDGSPRIRSRKSNKPSSKLVEELVSDHASPVPAEEQEGDGAKSSPVKRFKDRVSGYMSPPKSRKTKGKHMSLDDEDEGGLSGTPNL